MPTTDRNNTKLLLHFDGPDGATTTTDSSLSGHTATFSSNAQIDTAKFKFGSASLFVGGGATSGIHFPDHEDWNFGANPFTVDFWVFVDAAHPIDDYNGFFGMSNSAFGTTDTTNFFSFSKAGGGDIYLSITGIGTPVFSYTGSISQNQWHHIALIRGWNGDTNLCNTTIDGVGIETRTFSGTVPNFTGGFFVGWHSIGDSTRRSFPGWIDEFRVLKGEAYWTSGFTPPTAPYTLSDGPPPPNPSNKGSLIFFLG